MKISVKQKGDLQNLKNINAFIAIKNDAEPEWW